MKLQRKTGLAFTVLVVLFAFYIFMFIFETDIVLALGISVLRNLQHAILLCFGITAIYVIYGTAQLFRSNVSNMVVQRNIKREFAGVQENPAKKLMYDISEYIRIKGADNLFVKPLNAINEMTQQLESKVGSVLAIVAHRFERDTLSYSQFAAPVEELSFHLISLGQDMIQKLNLFDADFYAKRVERNKQRNVTSEHEEVLEGYITYVRSVYQAFDKAIIQLDRLVLEIGKLSEEDLQASITLLSELDTIIRNTKLYQ